MAPRKLGACTITCMLEFLFCVLVIAGPLALAYYLGLFSGALYIPTDARTVENMLDAAGLTACDTLVDIGSGDGRLVVAAAQRGIVSKGYEINPALVWVSNRAIKKAGMEHLASVEWKNFWDVDLSPYSVVTIFGIKHIMGRLERKLGRELESGSRVVCNLFPLPGWEGKKDGGVFVYVR